MNTIILTGKEPAIVVLESLKADVITYAPKLVIIQIGDDAASNAYVRQKISFCTKINMQYEYKKLPETSTLEELLSCIYTLNKNADVTGFFIQLPLPAHLQPHMYTIINAINPAKDVDGFHAYNSGNAYSAVENEFLPPATPAGVILLLEHYKIDIAGKNIVVIGQSSIVGKPLSIMLANRHATVTMCHNQTKDITQFTKTADLVCIAVGKCNLLTKDMVSQHAIIIDIGFNHTKEGLRGDADFAELSQYCAAITPVPGGIGLMTVAALMKNVVTAAKKQRSVL